MRANKHGYDCVKRGFDVVGSAIGLIVLSPVIGALSLAVQVKLGTPVIYKQQRPGKDGELFTLYKFRSMKIVDERDDVENDHLRITEFGQRIRSLSLDELPSLLNVLIGDMSLVGPRPLLIEYLPLYTDEQARRHEVRPGITGLAQVNGRNELAWDKKFALDVEYVEERSLSLDLHILVQTVVSVFTRRGVSKSGQTTTDKFRGSSSEY